MLVVIRAWAAVHGTVAGTLVLLLTAALAVTVGGRLLGALWGAEMPAVVPVMALLPVLAASGIALAAANRTAVATDRLARSRRIALARTVWLHAWLVLGTAALAVRGVVDAQHDWQLDAVNLLLYGGLALLVVVVGLPGLAWAPPALLALVAMLLGSDERTREFRWWAASLSADLTAGRLALAAGVWTCAALLYAARGGHERGS